jgi:hypothetical protein
MKITISNGKKTVVIEATAVGFEYVPKLSQSPQPPIILPTLEGSIECDISWIDPFALALPDGDPKKN